jgi:hypothetical protein
MKNMAKTFLVAAVMTVLGIYASHQPVIKSAVGRGVRDVGSRLKNEKEGELDRYQLRLEENLVQFGESRTRLDQELSRTMAKDAERREELARIEHLLACFKSAWGDGQRTSFPVTVFTRSYSKVELESTVQSLLDKRSELESLQNNGVAQLQQAKAQVEVRLAETRRHLDNMPVYTALAVTGETVGRADLVTDSLESCVAANQAFLKAPPRTGSGGSTVAGAGSGGSEVGSVVAAVDFLTPAVELKDEKSGESGPPTVSELTAALRALVQERDVDGQ